MAHIYTALIQQRGEWWIGRIQEIPSVNCQERTRIDNQLAAEICKQLGIPTL